MSVSAARRPQQDMIMRLAKSPMAILFISSNIANVANLAFNMIFARLMGPELFSDLALILTLKLAALSLFSAAQFGLSGLVASGKMNDAQQSDLIAGVSKLSFKICIPICIVLFALLEWLAGLFSLSDIWAIGLVFLTIPALVPISLYRGGAYGRVDLPRIVSSTQLEWIARLIGGLVLWFAGVGLVGVTAALVASVYIGALCASRSSERRAYLHKQTGQSKSALLIVKASAPFAALQVAQILMLDGDLFVAKSALEAADAGYLAALGLIQRIFFFAFLSFSALLLPMVAKKYAQNDRSGARLDLLHMLAALCAIALMPLLVITLLASLVCGILFGEAYGPMAQWAPYAACSALCFAIAHLVTMYFVAREKLISAYVFAGAGFLVLGLLAATAMAQPDLGTLIITKFILMISVAILSLVMVARDT